MEPSGSPGSFSKEQARHRQGILPLPSRIQFLNHLGHWNCHLSFYRYQLMLTKAVNSCINLTSSCIHNRTDQCSGIIQIICQCIHSGNFHQRLFQRKTKSLGCSRTDTKSGKGPGPAATAMASMVSRSSSVIFTSSSSMGRSVCECVFFVINCIFRNQVSRPPLLQQKQRF